MNASELPTVNTAKSPEELLAADERLWDGIKKFITAAQDILNKRPGSYRKLESRRCGRRYIKLVVTASGEEAFAFVDRYTGDIFRVRDYAHADFLGGKVGDVWHDPEYALRPWNFPALIF